LRLALAAKTATDSFNARVEFTKLPQYQAAPAEFAIDRCGSDAAETACRRVLREVEVQLVSEVPVPADFKQNTLVADCESGLDWKYSMSSSSGW